jgi:hypothetical protein
MKDGSNTGKTGRAAITLCAPHGNNFLPYIRKKRIIVISSFISKKIKPQLTCGNLCGHTKSF